ncbi:unnamed protein product [Effrenium voratum]|nr:unnamed protein product [Effrenium voratum]
MRLLAVILLLDWAASDELAQLRLEVQQLRQRIEERQLQSADDINQQLLQKVEEAREQAASQSTALDTIWLLACGTLCMFMHVGFAMVESGSCRAKNASDVLIKNVLGLCVGSVAWWACGWALAFGTSYHGLVGTTGFVGEDLLVSGGNGGALTYAETCDEGCTSKLVHWFFQWAFCTTTASIVSGGVAERIKCSNFAVFTFLMSTAVYPVIVSWTWGGGWLSTLLEVGYTDFAGSGVVHLTGGTAALVGASILGPRGNRFLKPAGFEAHNLPLVVLGTLFLWAGWLAFNAGSSGALHDSDTAALTAQAVMNTVIAGAAGGMTTILIRLALIKKYDLTGLCNGVLAGCVSITAGCANMNAGAAFVTATLGACFYLATSHLLLRWQIDDPVDASPVHGACGLWGVLAAAIFDWGGLERYHGGNGWTCWGYSDCIVDAKSAALLVQLVAGVTIVAWAGTISFAFFRISACFGCLRVDERCEEEGIDATEFAQSTAYTLNERERMCIELRVSADLGTPLKFAEACFIQEAAEREEAEAQQRCRAMADGRNRAQDVTGRVGT